MVEDHHILLRSFRDGFFPYIGAEIKDYFEVLKTMVNPGIIFTHYRKDLHQDHRLICELTWNTFRDHLILEYEIPKYDGDLGSPNFYVRLEETTCLRKVKILCDSFSTQTEKYWFIGDTFLSLMRIRGVEARSPSQYAEAFYANKLVF
jgi:LmbE family N-acetylglucosaminyl deacetylase